MRTWIVVVGLLVGCGVDTTPEAKKEPTCNEIGCTFYDCTDFGPDECLCDLYVDGKPEEVMCLHTDEPVV